METRTAPLPPPPYPEGGHTQGIFAIVNQQIVQTLDQVENMQSSHEVQNRLENGEEIDTDENQDIVTKIDSQDIQKKLLYKHPLFPLMALLFEKCEQATQTSDCPSSESFDVDIEAFVQHQETDNKPFFLEIPELDELMVKAIQVLRIHLLELEKVNDLCKDFCQRYISCLKGKLQNEQLLRIEGMDSPEREYSLSENLQHSNPLTPTNTQTGTVLSDQGQIMSGNTVYQMVHTPQGLVAQPIQIAVPASANPTAVTTPIKGSTPMSQIGVPEQISPPVPAINMLSQVDDDDDKKSAKRGILPKQATQIMKSWLFQHIVHPYPTEEEKKTLAGQTGLSILQINNWFINARRRILQPMLDQTNPDGTKQKKPKPPQNRPQKYWPESLSQIAQLTCRDEADSEEDSMQSQSHTGEETGPEENRASMADILQGMNQMVNTSNADVTSIINNVQQATHALVTQNGRLDPQTFTNTKNNVNIDRNPITGNS